MKRVIIESPYSGDLAVNLRYARCAMSDCLKRGEAPFASHLLYTQPFVLDDDIEEERALGMAAGFVWGAAADIIAVYTDLGITPGMEEGIFVYESMNVEIEHRSLPHWKNFSRDQEAWPIA